MAVSPILRAQGVTKIYGTEPVKVTALDSADISVGRGELVAIMGPSGSGKSTFLHLLGGLDTVTSGRIWIDGTEITGLPDKALTLVRRAKIGFIFQSYNLLPTLSAEENVSVPLIIANMRKRDYQAKVTGLFKLIGLEPRRGHRPAQLSGGEQQRVAVARALVTDPIIILADEPTGNLDRKHGREVLDLLKRAAGEMGRTIVMVTHDPWAATYADRVVFLRDGSVIKELELGGAGDVEAVIAGLKELGD